MSLCLYYVCFILSRIHSETVMIDRLIDCCVCKESCVMPSLRISERDEHVIKYTNAHTAHGKCVSEYYMHIAYIVAGQQVMDSID